MKFLPLRISKLGTAARNVSPTMDQMITATLVSKFGM